MLLASRIRVSTAESASARPRSPRETLRVPNCGIRRTRSAGRIEPLPPEDGPRAELKRPAGLRAQKAPPDAAEA